MSGLDLHSHFIGSSHFEFILHIQIVLRCLHLLSISQMSAFTHTHTHTHTYIYIYMKDNLNTLRKNTLSLELTLFSFLFSVFPECTKGILIK